MKLFACVALAVAACGGAPATLSNTADAVSFPRPSTVVGDRSTEDQSLDIRFVLPGPAGPISFAQRRASTTTTQVLAATDGVMTKARFTYLERTELATQAGEEQAAPQPLLGKSYVVARTPAGLVFSTDAGAPVTPEEAAALDEEHDRFGKENAFARLLASRPWLLGEAYAATPADLVQFNEDNAEHERPTAEAITLTLQSVDGARAIFALSLTMKVVGKARFTMTPSGTLTIDRSRTAPLSVELAGPLSGTAMGSPISGQLAGKNTWSYDR